jgi:acetyltransferase-like isoleucine patch superfamily enzyme
VTSATTFRSGYRIPGDWHDGAVPANVVLGDDAYVETSYSFQRCRSSASPGVTIGRSSGVYRGTMFDLGPGARATIGDYVLLHGARIIADTEVRIGDYTMISWRVVIMDTRRVSPDLLTRRADLRAVAERPGRELVTDEPQGRVHIGANVWIGFDACILPNVSIGDGAVVGARAVVCDDVPPGAVVAGHPAVIIRQAERPT